MKILFLLGMYHPRQSANGLCCKNIVDECVANGWDVTCVINSYRGNTKAYELDGASIHPIKPRLSYRMLEWCEYHPQSKLSPLLKKVASLMNKLKLALRSFSWPYISSGYTRRFYRKAEALYKKEHFDVVVGVYTPIDSLLAAYKLKKKHEEVKFIPYYLDALAGGWGPSKWKQKRLDRRLFQWECFIDRLADAMISMESSRDYHKAHPLPFDKNEVRYFLDVPTMLPAIRMSQRENSQRKVALFAGNIAYPRRNPIPLLEVFAPVCNKFDIELWFVGDCNKKAIFKPYVEATNGKIRLLGTKTHKETLELEGSANMLVNIGSENPYTIPCKIFEYMRFGKPIISTYAIDNEPSLECLKKYQFAHFIDERIPAAESTEKLLRFLELNQQVFIPEDFCQKNFYQNTPQAFTDTLKKIVEDVE